MPFDGDIFGSNFGSRKCSTGDTAWVRPTGWLPMPNTPADTVNMLVRIEDSLDSTFASVAVSCPGSFYIDWGDGLGEQTYSSGVNAVKEYVYATALSNPQDATLGYKQAMVKVRGTGIFIFRLNIIPPAVSTWTLFVQPYIDISLNLPICTTLQSNESNCQCRKVERWVILACGDIIDMSYMFYNNYTCCSYTFPPGFGSVATNMFNMFSSNYSCPSYEFPAGFGSVCTNMSSMFYNNFDCRTRVFPSGFGSVCTNMSSMFYNNFAYQTSVFPNGFGSVCTNMSSMFSSNHSAHSYTFPNGFGSVCTNMSNMFSSNYSCRSYSFPGGFGAAVTTAADIGAISARSTTKIRGLAYAQTFSIANSNLQRNELIAVFNALPTVTSKSLTITGNPGVPALTEANDLIATGKGWILNK